MILRCENLIAEKQKAMRKASSNFSILCICLTLHNALVLVVRFKNTEEENYPHFFDFFLINSFQGCSKLKKIKRNLDFFFFLILKHFEKWEICGPDKNHILSILRTCVPRNPGVVIIFKGH